MKISVDGEYLFELSNIQKKVIMNDIHADEFQDDMKRRIHYILTHKYERCLERLRGEWMPKLSNRVSSVPTNSDELVQLILSQPDYKCRKTREDEKANKEKFERSSTFQTQ